MLNARQLEILLLIAKGYTNREIASAIHLTENTVKSHIKAIYVELGVRNRVRAALAAAKMNLV